MNKNKNEEYERKRTYARLQRWSAVSVKLSQSLGAVLRVDRLFDSVRRYVGVVLQYIHGGPKSDTFMVFQFHLLLDALYLQFLFTHVTFSLNNVCRCKQVLFLCE